MECTEGLKEYTLEPAFVLNSIGLFRRDLDVFFVDMIGGIYNFYHINLLVTPSSNSNQGFLCSEILSSLFLVATALSLHHLFFCMSGGATRSVLVADCHCQQLRGETRESGRDQPRVLSRSCDERQLGEENITQD